MVTLLILWCVWTTLAAGTYPNALDSVHSFKDHLFGFARKLRGMTSRPVIDAGDGGGDGFQDMRKILSRVGTLQEAFILHRRLRSKRTSTLLGDPAGSNGLWGSPDGTEAETDNKVPTSVV